MKILVVEEDLAFASRVVQMIERWGHHGDKSATAMDALQRSRNERFDLILLNEFLPDATAVELIPQLKELRPLTGIIVMAGEGESNLEPEIRKLGIFYYMLKPFVSEELKIILAHISKKSLPL